ERCSRSVHDLEEEIASKVIGAHRMCRGRGREGRTHGCEGITWSDVSCEKTDCEERAGQREANAGRRGHPESLAHSYRMRGSSHPQARSVSRFARTTDTDTRRKRPSSIG